ncbi:hypothetical protein GCM10007160_37680 [Litchfieldella qijiaojingensis]|uniref:4-alpha-L-fucosyltransferase n=2 Tax=Litchfieldella qijiaojingensis TaxID=980347 RepID=A0ABQ2Z6F1_9GAMM|nr:hypothetical protein GCM10007160_37680 [Halomonas qijiaojingensis]
MLLFLNPWVLKKCYWVIWGGDLYRYQKPKKRNKERFVEYARCFVIKRVGYLVTYFPGDATLARNWYGAKGKNIKCFMYLSNVFKPVSGGVKKKKSIKTLLVGNSANPSNDHELVFKKIAKLDLSNWRIVVPLSYGDHANSKKIIELGRELFGERFEPLTNFLPYDEYLKLLSDVDIAIFAHNRQQAMGNTISLLGMGKRVYIRRDTSSFELLSSIGLDVGSIDSLTLDKPVFDEENNRKIIERYFSEGSLKSQLKKIVG